MKYLILTTFVISTLGCGPLPKNADLSTWLGSEGGAPTHPRAFLAQHFPTRAPHRASHKTNMPANHASEVLAIAQRLERNGDYQGAIERYQQVTELVPNAVDSLHHLAVLHDKHGDPSQSSRYYLRAMQLAPDDADLVCDYGYSRYIQGDLVQAETLLRRAVTLDANLVRAYNNLGLALAEQGKDQEAVVAFQQTGLSPQESQQNLRNARIAGRLSTNSPNR